MSIAFKVSKILCSHNTCIVLRAGSEETIDYSQLTINEYVQEI